MAISQAAADAAVTYFDSWLAFRQRYDRLPGVQAAILHNGRLLLSKGYGHADVEAGVTLTPRHLFRVASHSKIFTATAIVQLVERGVLRLDDPAGQWLPSLDGLAVANVTIRELLSHGGGIIRDGEDADYWQLIHPFPDEQRLRDILVDKADVLPPNERFKYSNVGYAVLGLIVTAASGDRYVDYVREHILDVLTLPDTFPEYDVTRESDYATGYTALAYADDRIPIDHVDTAAMTPAYGFTSTAQDMVHFVCAHGPGDPRLLSERSKRLMQRTEWRVRLAGHDAPTGYGLGFETARIGAWHLVGHGGGYPGHSTRTFFDPADRLAVSVLTNAIDGPAYNLAKALFGLIDLATEAERSPGQAGVDLRPFCGRFANLWEVFDVVDLGGRLFAIDPTRGDPAGGAIALDVEDARTLRVGEEAGHAASGEPVSYRIDGDTVTTVRGVSMTTTSWPLERVSDLVAGLHRVQAGDGRQTPSVID